MSSGRARLDVQLCRLARSPALSWALLLNLWPFKRGFEGSFKSFEVLFGLI